MQKNEMLVEKLDAPRSMVNRLDLAVGSAIMQLLMPGLPKD
jgi:hypothetical protein